MIAKIIVPMLLFIVLPEIYFELHFFLHKKNFSWWKRMLWWLPAVIMIVFSVCLATADDFLPEDAKWIEIYFFALAVLVVPKAVFAGCSGIGWLYRKYTGSKYNFGNLIGAFLAVCFSGMMLYGLTAGFKRLEIKHIDLTFSDLPASFDGYRIVHFSDAHVGTFMGPNKWILKRDVDSINAQHGDMVVFTGDIQNTHPRELYPHLDVLKSIQAPDVVYSILGNHDYSKYVKAKGTEAMKNEQETQAFERSLGWNLLMNENRTVRRGGYSIFVAGTEYDNSKPDPFKADIGKTVMGIPNGAFTLMLVHTPIQWKDLVLPNTKAQVTLAGHTHGGQVMAFGVRPTMLSYKEDYGLFEEAGRYLEVTAGLGGTVPFRFGATPEIVVITLHRK